MERLVCFAMILLPTDNIRSFLTEIALNEKKSPAAIKEAPLYELARDASIYLIPLFDNVEIFEKFLEERHEEIFKTELSICTPNEELWPKNLSFENFKDWFIQEIHINVYSAIPADMQNEDANMVALLFSPKQSCLDWVNENIDKIDRAYFKDLDINFATLRIISPIYIIKRIGREASGIQQFIQQNYEQIFEHILQNLCEDKSIWPKNRNMDMFKSWFNVDIHHFLFNLLSS